jgi:hypothetical protein
MARRILWFATAYTLVIIVHEAAHALTAYALGLETTLYHFWVNVDPSNRATLAERSAYGVAGPAASLLLGVAAWLAYRNRRVRNSAAAMPLLYLAASGISNFFGNLMSAAFVGDFANVANWLALPGGGRYAVSIFGAIVLTVVLFVTGRELARWTPLRTSRATAALTAVVLPVLIGTVLIILVNQPVPIAGFAMARVGESTFWLFAAAGAFTAGPPSALETANPRLRWQDGAIAVVVVAAVRIMSAGITLLGPT